MCLVSDKVQIITVALETHCYFDDDKDDDDNDNDDVGNDFVACRSPRCAD